MILYPVTHWPIPEISSRVPFGKIEKKALSLKS